MEEISAIYVLLLLGVGLLAGVINTLAGGGSNLTLPALMLLGMPADVANATNRVGVFLQSLVAVSGFQRSGKLDTQNAWPILLPTLLGSLLGAATASWMPPELLKPILLGSMLAMAGMMLFRPDVMAPPLGSQNLQVKESPVAVCWLLLAGFYGGFVQAGVGFILLAVLAGGLRYDLLRANALKVLCTVAFTLVALLVFIARDQVWWLPGLVLAVGTMAGAAIGVKVAIKLSHTAMKWIVFLMTLLASMAVMLL